MIKFEVVKVPEIAKRKYIQNDWFEIIQAAKDLKPGSAIRVPFSELKDDVDGKKLRNAVYHHLGHGYGVHLSRSENSVYVTRNGKK